VIIPTQFLPGAAVARIIAAWGCGCTWNDAWIFVSAVIRRALERDRALHAALPVTGASLATCWRRRFPAPLRAQQGRARESVRRLAGAGLLRIEDDLVEVAPSGEQLWRTGRSAGSRRP